jgi:hypothetical protein
MSSEIENEKNDAQFEEPTETDKDLVTWIMDHVERWRDFRDNNYMDSWEEYERIFRGQWAEADSTRESERSRIISPATQQAVETSHAEIMEAIFGQGEFFDIEDDVMDVNGNPIDVQDLKRMMMDDFAKDKVRKSIDQIGLMAKIYGTGIGEIVVKTAKEYVPTTQAIPGVTGQAAIGVIEKDRISVTLNPINPKNFLFDPNGTTVDDCMGVAIEKPVSLHKIVAGMEAGIYRKVDISSYMDDDSLEATQEVRQFQDNKATMLTYYGLVPRELLDSTGEQKDVVDLFPEDSTADEYSDMVEAIVVIGNGTLLLKAEENPYMMKDRPVMAYQDDTVPNRLLGRGVVEKAYNMQKAIDAQYRAYLDSLALTTSPMIAMDATRLPRGAKFEVKPGKALLVNGNPSEIMMPFKFGSTDGNAPAAAQNFERMLLQATGTMDTNGMISQVSRDASQGGISMAVASLIKKNKRTLTNFQEDFLSPFIKKAAFRFMQFDPERYPSADLNFVPLATLGIMAREYEQSQFIALLQTLGPNTPVLPLILKGVIANSSLSNRAELIEALGKMAQPDPQAQAMQQQQAMLAIQAAQAQIAVNTTQAERNKAEAMNTMIEAQLKPKETEAKIIASTTQNLPNNDQLASQEFDRRVKIADLMLKEKDIEHKLEVVKMQTAAKHAQKQTDSDFLKKIIGE